MICCRAVQMSFSKTSIRMPDLSGLTVVITRPRLQAQVLEDLITANGGTAVLFPVIEIVAPTDPGPLMARLNRLDEFDIAIFISANAVTDGMKFIQTAGGLPATLQLAVVGDATARALAKSGHPADIHPKNKFNSEALLAVEEMNNVAGKNIIIFRGDGGRELLADTLRARGANVEYAECYQRVKPDIDVSNLMNHWQNNDIDAIVVMSNQGLRNLQEMVGKAGQPYLQDSQLVVISERTVKLAQQSGFSKQPLIATTASDQAVMEVLARLKGSAKR